MPSRFDVIVAGLGAFGAAAARAAAQRGAKVLGLDRLYPPHTSGSSHGRTRIIREAYFEGPFYVPLVREARLGWKALEEESGRELLRPTGGLAIGPLEGELVAGSLRSARHHGIAHELLDAKEVVGRFPGVRLPEGAHAVFEPDAGVLLAEPSVEALLSSAQQAGARLRLGDPLEAWSVDGSGGVEVRSGSGTFRADSLVLALGAWLGDHAGPGLALSIQAERKAVHWFGPVPDASDEERRAVGSRPLTLWEHAPGRLFYTIPEADGATKAALHHEGTPADPDDPLHGPTPEEEQAARALLTRHLPAAAGPVLRRTACLYANSPDLHFVLGPHPGHPQIVLAGGGSGHGFKFAPAIGALAAEIALEGRSERTPPELSPARFLPRGDVA